MDAVFTYDFATLLAVACASAALGALIGVRARRGGVQALRRLADATVALQRQTALLAERLTAVEKAQHLLARHVARLQSRDGDPDFGDDGPRRLH